MSTTSQPRAPRAYWPLLDLVRAGAALLVVLSHARFRFFPEYAAVEAPGLLTKVFYLVTGLPHEGVVLFFLVSGFLVGGAAWEAIAAGRFDTARYFGNRFVRVYLVLIPGIALTLVIHAIGTRLFPGNADFAVAASQPWSWSMGICHLGCLQGIWCSVLALNAPLWSLSYEWLLYLAAPVVLGTAYAAVRSGWRIVGSLVVAAVAWSILPGFLLWSFVLFWVLGAVAYRVSGYQPLPMAVGIAGVAMTIAGLLLSRLHVLPQLATDWIVAFGFAVVLASPTVLKLSFAPRVTTYLADLSYSLYVIHLPVIVLLVAILEQTIAFKPAGAGLWPTLLFGLVIGITVAVAAVFAHFTERHTRALQRSMTAGVGAGRVGGAGLA